MIQSLLGDELRCHDIAFHQNGRIDINSNAAKMLSLKKGDVIDIALYDGEYYLFVRHENCDFAKFRASCVPTNKGKCNNMRVYSKKICKKIISMCGIMDVKLNVGKPTKINEIGYALPLITAKYIQYGKNI